MNIAILGYGTVGKGVEKMALENNYNVLYILMRKIDELYKENMTNDFEKIVNDKAVDVIVECIGGDEPAFTYVFKALSSKIPVVSSNKKMIVNHFKELINLSNKNNVPFLFSSAAGGGIPFLPTLNNIRQSDKLICFKGIINGTSNFILNKMYYDNIDFESALKKAQELGYAEMNPSDDIDGVDTANKLVLGLGVGFNCFVQLDNIFIKGIRNYNLNDLNFIKQNGYHACLLAKVYNDGNNYCMSVIPTFVQEKSVFYNIKDNLNCLNIEAKNLGNLSLIGQGAGSLPTASNIIRDIQMLSNPYRTYLKEEVELNYDNTFGKFYLRTTNKVDSALVQVDLGNNCYITNKISINNLKKILSENDFVGEIIDD